MKISGALFACIFVLISPLLAQQPDEQLSPEAQQVIETQAASALAQIRPRSSEEKALTRIKFKEGWIYWGSPLDPNEVVAFTSLQQEPTKDEEFNYPPTYLCYFSWEGGQWKQRQFLGHGAGLEFHVRQAGKEREHYLQASCATGRYEGEEHSWRYDPKTKKLVPTGLDDWGRYWIAGDYICYPRGRERLAHDSTVWIYRLQDGKRGELVASLHEVDDGRFAITFREPGAGTMRRWSFVPTGDDHQRFEARQFEVRLEELREDQDDASVPIDGDPDAEIIVDEQSSLESNYAFTLLTGLSPELLKDTWMDSVPPPNPLKRISMKVTGNAEVVKHFAWEQTARAKAQEAAAARAAEAAIGDKALQGSPRSSRRMRLRHY